MAVKNLNPFDTGRLPLSAQQLASAVALCHLLVGRSRDEDKEATSGPACCPRRLPACTEAAALGTWKKHTPKTLREVSKEVATLLEYQSRRLTGDEGFADVFAQFKEELREAPELGEQIAKEIELLEETMTGLGRNSATAGFSGAGFGLLTAAALGCTRHCSTCRTNLQALARRGS